MIRFLTFSQIHNKRPVAGSTAIRVDNLIKHWPEAALYKYGEYPDALIFQKVYCTQDYKFPAHFENMTILDICDPDWLDGSAIVETAHAADAVTCPTEPIAEFIRQFHNKVVVVPDRFDVDVVPPPKQHKGRAKRVVWFGYSHNAELLKPALEKILALGLELILISNDDPILQRWTVTNEEFYKFVKHPNDDTIYKLLQVADFAILPEGNRPVDRFKSNNKTIIANLAGLPVARTAEEVEKYMDGKARQDWVFNNYHATKKEYDVRNSVKQMKDLIKEVQNG